MPGGADCHVSGLLRRAGRLSTAGAPAGTVLCMGAPADSMRGQTRRAEDAVGWKYPSDMPHSQDDAQNGSNSCLWLCLTISALLCVVTLLVGIIAVAGWDDGLGDTLRGIGALGALATAIVAVHAYRQRKEADARAEWWRRAQFTIEQLAKEEDLNQGIGIEMSFAILNSDLAKAEDLDMFQAVALRVKTQREHEKQNEEKPSEAFRPKRRARRLLSAAASWPLGRLKGTGGSTAEGVTLASRGSRI